MRQRRRSRRSTPEVERFAASAVLRLSRGRLRVEQGRVADGLEDYLEAGVLLARAMITSPSYLRWRSEARGPASRPRRSRVGGTPRSRGAGSRRSLVPPALGVAKRAAGVVTGGERGEVLLREAIDAFERGDAGLEEARSLADLGAMLRRHNRRTEARELLRKALDTAHRSGAKPLAERAETELRATGARPRPGRSHRARRANGEQRRIAELASEGLTNREIAQMLFITTRTVEGHLTASSASSDSTREASLTPRWPVALQLSRRRTENLRVIRDEPADSLYLILSPTAKPTGEARA